MTFAAKKTAPLFVLSIFAVAACGDDEPQPVDAGMIPDLGMVDIPDTGAGGQDGGVTNDAGDGPDGGEQLPDIGGLPMGVAPAARADTAFAVNPNTGQMIMVYGDRAVPMRCNFPPSDFVADAFSYFASYDQWAELPFAGGAPQARARTSAVWDELNDKYILFGGRYRAGASGDYTLYSDVWALDPATSTWSMLADSGGVGRPAPRVNFGIASDGSKMYIHGGNISGNALNLNCLNDTWVFDFSNNTWTQIGMGGTQPPIRCFHSASVDRQRQRLYVFAGGGNGAFQGPFYDDLWYLDLVGGTWTQVPMSNPWPPARIRPGLDYDAANDQLVLFGGHDNGFPSQGDIGPTNDVWTFDLANSTWTSRRLADRFNSAIVDACNPPADFTIAEVNSPERRQSHVFFVHDGFAYAYGGKTDCGISNDTWKLDLSTYLWEQISVSFRGMTCPHSTQPDCSDASALYCGS